MNQHTVPDLSASRRSTTRLHRVPQPGSGFAAILLRLAENLRHRLAEIDKRIARDRETREAIEHLESMSDAQLRDIGISRADIADAVRFGRRHYLDR